MKSTSQKVPNTLNQEQRLELTWMKMTAKFIKDQQKVLRKTKGQKILNKADWALAKLNKDKHNELEMQVLGELINSAP